MKQLKPLFTIVFLFLSGFLGLSSLVPKARAAAVGLVCISDQSLNPTDCPFPIANLTGSVGSDVTAAVNVQGIDSLDAFDVSVRVDPAVLQPVSISVADSVIPQNVRFVLRQTVNSTTGVARLALVDLGGFVPGPLTGNLFDIVYKVLSSSDGSAIVFQLGCSGPSPSVPGVCVNLANPNPVPVAIQTGNFGPETPDFLISAAPSFETVQTGFGTNATIVIESIGEFAGTVKLSIALISPCVVPSCPSWSLNSATLTTSSDGSAWTSGGCSDRVLRGGAWYFYPWLLRAAFRLWNSTDSRDNVVGFRLGRTLIP